MCSASRRVVREKEGQLASCVWTAFRILMGLEIPEFYTDSTGGEALMSPLHLKSCINTSSFISVSKDTLNSRHGPSSG